MKIIEPSPLQKSLNKYFSLNVRNLFLLMLIYSTELILRILIFFLGFGTYKQWDSAANQFMNFMMVPELAISKGEIFLEVQNIILTVQGVLFILKIIFLVAFNEKKYIAILKKHEMNLITLNSIEVSNFKNRQQAQKFERILMLIEPVGNLVLKTSYVFDMSSFNLQQNKINTNSQERFESSGQRRHSEIQPLKSSFHNISENHFSNKIIVTFSQQSIVKEIINCYNSGILGEKIRSDLHHGKQSDVFSERENDFVEKILENQDEFNKIHIQMAQDPNDIIWENYYQVDRKKKIIFIAVIYIITCGLLWTLSGFMEYILTMDFIKINFIDQQSGIVINLFVTEFKTSGASIGIMIAKFVIQQLFYQFIQILLNFKQFSYYSSQDNFNFIFLSIFDLIFMFPATHYGYTQAIFDMREQVLKLNFDSHVYFSVINLQWVKISFILLFSSVMKMIFFKLKCLFLQWRAKSKDCQIVFDTQIVTTTFVSVFMYLGFYQSLLNPLSLIVCTLNLLIIYFYNKKLQRNEKLMKTYLSYSNITMIMQFSLFVFGIGGFLSFNVNYNFSIQYQSNLSQDIFLPYFFITCSIICLIFSPFLYLLMRHNSVSLRVLNNFDQKHPTPQQNQEFRKLLEKKNYYNTNPYYKEASKLGLEDEQPFRSNRHDYFSQLICNVFPKCAVQQDFLLRNGQSGSALLCQLPHGTLLSAGQNSRH